MIGKIITVVGYHCKECNIDFDAKMEYVKAMEHGMKFDHSIVSIEEVQENIDEFDDVNVPFKESKERGSNKSNRFQYGYIDVDI